MNTHAGIVMVGSANMDIVLGVERIPAPGETVLATSLAKHPGGKGLNQAVAAARAGATTTMIGAVGTDENGNELETVMTEAGIDARMLRHVAEPTGTAMISVDTTGENAIIVASGANATITTLTDNELDAVRGATVLLMQLELPISAVTQAARAARSAGGTVMLNAAPALEVPDELIDALDYLIVNEHEATVLSGEADLSDASRSLADRVNRLVVTLGTQGSELWDAGKLIATVPARRVTAVDTTGAGDTFCGAFAAAISQGRDFESAARFATAAAALSVQTHGAVPSIPHREQIEAVLAS
ncbi:MAG TPA: ribokinase [Terrimesophilobacter sp.]|nr:ribokinase [Terrimesophilobacter sp.]